MVKAAVMVAPGQLEVREFPMPAVGDDAMLLKVELSGICGTDKHAYRGEGRLYGGTEAATSYAFPVIPGHETVGVIADIGKRAHETIHTYGEKIQIGDRVVVGPDIFCGHCYYCENTCGFIWCDNMQAYGSTFSCENPPHLFGGWAEYMYILPNSYVFKVPNKLKPEIAVLTELMAVTYNFDKAKEFYSMAGEGFKTGDTIVVQGVGPLGLCHVIKARMLGAGDIVAIDASDFRLRMAKEFGADVTFNVNSSSREERVQAIKEMTKGVGADLVVECAGAPSVIPEGIELLRKGGMYILTGIFVDTGEVISINPHRDLVAKNIRLIGQTDEPPSGYLPTMKLMEKFSRFFHFERIVTHQFGIEEVQQAMKTAMNTDASMKVVINPMK